MKTRLKKLFSQKDLDAIAGAISEVEKNTSGEIRVSVRQKRGWREKKLTVEELARKEFQLLGMTNTKDRTGVLIFLLLDDRKFFILADEGIHTKVEQENWNKIAGEMSFHFSQNRFLEGIVQTVQSVGKILAQHFPRKSDDTNELPNEVKIS